MCDPTGGVATAAIIAATVASAGTTYYQGERQRKMQGAANQEAKKNADRMATMAEQENNRKNAKTPDAAAMLASATLSGKSGQSGTMLTGPAGVDPSKLLLGRSTLLGA
jgi:hypothetical protein